MQEFWTTVRNMGWNLTHRLGVIDVIDILIVAVIIYELLLLTRHTRGSALLKGLFILGVVVILSNLIGLTSLNDLSAILDGDIEAINGILHICSNVIPRSDRTTDDQLRVEGEKDLSIFYAALEATGFADTLMIERKNNPDGTAMTYDLGNNHNDQYWI